MAWLMVGAALLSAVALPKLKVVELPASVAQRDLLGFVAVLVAVAVGVFVSNRFGRPIAQALLGPVLAGGSLPVALQGKWVDLLALLLGIALTLPLAAWAARAARFETLLGGLSSYFAQPGAVGFLAFVVLYKLGDAFSCRWSRPSCCRRCTSASPRSASSTRSSACG